MRRAWALGLVLAACGAARADVATIRLGKGPDLPRGPVAPAHPAVPVAHVPETRSPPAIDGRLREDAWAGACALRLARTLDGRALAVQPTEVKLLRDAGALYVAFRCAEPSIERLRARNRPRDGEAWNDDSVEIYLGFDGRYHLFIINALGSLYDAEGKDRSWNGDPEAAVRRESGAWTVEVAIPLRGLDPRHERREWIANFLRNRYVTGVHELSAWSPTYGDDAHVPSKFGRLLFRPPPETVPPAGGLPARERAAETIRTAAGMGIIRFDLSALAGTERVYRADLLLSRSLPVTGADPAALERIEVLPLFAPCAPGGMPRVSDPPLTLRPPWFDRFDATASVRAWLSGQPNGGFFVKVCPLWDPGRTCLEVVHEGDPGPVPAQPTNVRLVHRAGQTFITWREVEPLDGDGAMTWGRMKRRLAEARAPVTYRIYVHDRPIDAATVRAARRLADVAPLSGYNANARNVEYLIGRAMIEPDEWGELARDYNGFIYTWHMDHERMDRHPLERFIIEEGAGPLPPGTGLYVHQPASPGARYYAVTSCRRGVENASDFTPANAPREPVTETTGPGEPVRQGRGLWGPFFDEPGTRWVYVQWCAPPLSPLPNMSFNWSVLLPPDGDGRVPAELYLHTGNFSYAKPRRKWIRHSIQIAPHDHPFSGWYGYHDAFGTLRSWREGVVRRHTHRRILAFLAWARERFPIDPDRIILCGGDGAAALAMRARDIFAYALITGFGGRGKVQGRILDPAERGRYAAAWGPKDPAIEDEDGVGSWGWAMLDRLARDRPDRDMPLIVCEGRSWGGIRQYGKGFGPLYTALQEARQPLIAGFGWDTKLIAPDAYTGLWRGLDLTRRSPLPAFANSARSREALQWGNVNWYPRWKAVEDRPDRLAITLYGGERADVTLRRRRAFRPRPGRILRWKARALPGPRGEAAPPQAGSVAVDARGLITVQGLRIGPHGVVLELTRGEAE